MGVTANITVGAPSLVKIGAYGAGAGSAVDVGYTEGGLTISSATEHYFHEVDQEVGQIGATKIKEARTTEVILAEPSLANLALAEGYPTTAVAGSTLDIGGSDTVTLREVFITCPGPGGASRLITFHKVIISGVTDYPMMKSDKSGVKLAITLLQDTSKSANQQYYSVVDSGGDVTPPTVELTDPAGGGTVDKDTQDTVTFTFTEADSAMDEGSLIYGNAANATIMIINQSDDEIVAGAISYDATTKICTFTPTSNWSASDELRIVITTGVRDTAGNHLAAIFMDEFSVTA